MHDQSWVSFTLCERQTQKEAKCRLCWSTTGALLASASDDHSVLLWSYPAHGRRPLLLQTEHVHNVFGVAWLPGDQQLVTGERMWRKPHTLGQSCCACALVKRVGVGTSRCQS